MHRSISWVRRTASTSSRMEIQALTQHRVPDREEVSLRKGLEDDQEEGGQGGKDGPKLPETYHGILRHERGHDHPEQIDPMSDHQKDADAQQHSLVSLRPDGEKGNEGDDPVEEDVHDC